MILGYPSYIESFLILNAISIRITSCGCCFCLAINCVCCIIDQLYSVCMIMVSAVFGQTKFNSILFFFPFRMGGKHRIKQNLCTFLLLLKFTGNRVLQSRIYIETKCILYIICIYIDWLRIVNIYLMYIYMCLN